MGAAHAPNRGSAFRISCIGHGRWRHASPPPQARISAGCAQSAVGAAPMTVRAAKLGTVTNAHVANMEPAPAAWRVWPRAALYREGWTWRLIDRVVTAGRLRRARRDAYLHGDVDAATFAACRIGGQLACVSELARRGVFVLEANRLHVRVSETAGRLRCEGREVRIHWSGGGERDAANVDLLDALREAMLCQPPVEAVATLDSALHLGLVDEADLAEVFRRLPRRVQILRRLTDAAAEAGSESIMRLLLRKAGCHVQSQVRIPGVGRVDFLVDGWLIIECDGEAHHGGWEKQRRDKRRDQVAASLGYATYRPIAEDIFWHRDAVMAAVRGLCAMRAVVRP